MTTTVSLPRTCPRCTGRLFHSRDCYGGYSSCMACGFVHEWLAGPAIEVPDAASGRRKRDPTCNGLHL